MTSASRSLIINSLIGITVTVVFLLLVEGSLRALSIGAPKGGKQAALAPVDRGSYLLRKNGYRGKRPCTQCPANNLRIVTMGGSSTFGVPMHYSGKTYSAHLQRFFSERRPAQSIEVLNGGVAGFGIWQIIETLRSVVLPDKPDVVIISSWFNDSSFIPGWYGFHGLSDHEAFQEVTRLRSIENNPIYQLIAKSFTYRSLQTVIAKLHPAPQKSADKKKRKKRSTPEEFELGLETVAQLSKEHNFLPIFVYEPLNRTSNRDVAVKANRYYQAVDRVAQKHDIPIVDTLTPLSQHIQEWLFYDFIHPNEHGHELIAEAIYSSLTDPSWHTERSKEFLKDKF